MTDQEITTVIERQGLVVLTTVRWTSTFRGNELTNNSTRRIALLPLRTTNVACSNQSGGQRKDRFQQSQN
jgi:hypothetical protein